MAPSGAILMWRTIFVSFLSGCVLRNEANRWWDIAQHYLTHLLKAKLEESKSRVVIVSSGGIRGVKDPCTSP